MRPLAATLARLDAAHEYCRFTAAVPDEPGWTSLAAVLDDPSPIERWFGELVERDPARRGHRDAVGSILAGWFGEVVAEPIAAALLAERRAWPLDPASMYVHRGQEGWFDGLAVTSDQVRALTSDPDAGDDGVETFGSFEALLAQVADDVVALLDPMFAAVRALAPFGRRGMWGSTADSIVAGSVWAAHRRGDATADAFDAAMAFVDALAERTPLLVVRPARFPVRWSGGDFTASRKGTCCLIYKFEAPDKVPASYCTTCPLRDDESRHEKFATWLDEMARSEAGSE